MILRLLLAVPLLLVAAPADADWAWMSQHEKLEGYVITYVGKVSRESKYVPDTFENIEWYEFKRGFSTQFCFQISGLAGLWGLGAKPALVLVDKDENVKLALLESSLGNIKVSVQSIVQVGCPSPY